MAKFSHMFVGLVPIAIFVLNIQVVNGYGTYSETTTVSTAPPGYQGDREQWGGVEEGHGGWQAQGGGTTHQHGRDRPPNQQGPPNWSESGSNYQDKGPQENGQHGNARQHQHDSGRNNDKPNLFVSPGHTERYGYPEGCVKAENIMHKCKYFVEIEREKDPEHQDTLHFQLSGHINYTGGYIAMGLSKDKIMGEDHIIECIRFTNQLAVYQSWSFSKSRPERLVDDPSIILQDDKYPVYNDGILTCKFRRPIKTSVRVKEDVVEFDLLRDKYYILLATGPLNSENSDKLGYHGGNPYETGAAYVSKRTLGYKDDPNSYLFGTGNSPFNCSVLTSILTLLSYFLMAF